MNLTAIKVSHRYKGILEIKENLINTNEPSTCKSISKIQEYLAYAKLSHLSILQLALFINCRPPTIFQIPASNPQVPTHLKLSGRDINAHTGSKALGILFNLQ